MGRQKPYADLNNKDHSDTNIRNFKDRQPERRDVVGLDTNSQRRCRNDKDNEKLKYLVGDYLFKS